MEYLKKCFYFLINNDNKIPNHQKIETKEKSKEPTAVRNKCQLSVCPNFLFDRYF